jgi:hypothetical protein
MITQKAMGHVGAQAFIHSENSKPVTPRFNKVTAPETKNVMKPVSSIWKTRCSNLAGII